MTARLPRRELTTKALRYACDLVLRCLEVAAPANPCLGQRSPVDLWSRGDDFSRQRRCVREGGDRGVHVNYKTSQVANDKGTLCNDCQNYMGYNNFPGAASTAAERS